MEPNPRPLAADEYWVVETLRSTGPELAKNTTHGLLPVAYAEAGKAKTLVAQFKRSGVAARVRRARITIEILD